MEPNIFMSDIKIVDHYRFKFAHNYTNNIGKLWKGFFDIEVDGKWAKGDFVEMGECEINLVSFCDDASDTVHTFILNNPNNPLIKEFRDEVESGKFGWQEIHDFVVNAVGGIKNAKKYNLLKTKYLLSFYDYEIELIADLFRTMHKCSPDFILGWNSSGFDLNYIINRIIALGYNPEDIMCDESWPIKVVRHVVDTKNENNLAERGDYTFISGLPVFIDQMIQYASRRKSKIGSYKSFKLDDIGLLEAKVQKLDYSHITNSVTELPWRDFKTFVIYNIMDVIVQKCIETKTQDIEYIFAKCITNNTTYKKGHRQTVYLINRMANDWYKMGYIIGNNTNKNNPKPPKYLGALVGKPENTNDYSKMKINGRAIWVCENLIDYDFKALYPSLDGENNIAPNTLIAKIEINEKVYDNENAYGIEAEKYSRSGEFIENMVTDNHIEFCHRWFKLAGFQEVLEDIDEYIENTYGLGKYSELEDKGYCSDIGFSPILPTTREPRTAIRENRPRVPSPIIFHNKRDSRYTYNKLIEESKNM
jgi:DNA polymerase elongation subunit (family B)